MKKIFRTGFPPTKGWKKVLNKNDLNIFETIIVLQENSQIEKRVD